jgi:hypothetical protein
LYELTHWLVYEGLAHLGETALGTRLVEGVDITLEEGEVQVHAGPVEVLQGLGHEGGVDPTLEGDFLDGKTGGHDVVGHRQGVGVTDDDLVLAGGHLVVGVLDGDADLLEGVDRLAPVLLGPVQWGEVEVPAPVEHLGVGA